MAVCASCSREIDDSEAILIQGKDKYAPDSYCSDCVRRIEATYEREASDRNLVGAMAVGVLVGVVSAVMWYAVVMIAKRQWWILALAVGFVVAMGVMRGAGRKTGRVLQVISLVITGASMAGGEFLMVNYLALQYLSEKGIRDLPMFVPFGLAWDLMVADLQANPLTILFWGGALLVAFLVPMPGRLNRV